MEINGFNLSGYHLAQTRAMKAVYRRFKVNKVELNALLILDGFLKARGKEVSSQGLAIRTHTADMRQKRRLETHFFHCLRKGLMGSFEFTRIPDSVCVGISDYGKQVLDYYKQEVISFQDRFKPLEVSAAKRESDRLLYVSKTAA